MDYCRHCITAAAIIGSVHKIYSTLEVYNTGDKKRRVVCRREFFIREKNYAIFRAYG